MSVLKSKRTTSKAEFVNLADEIDADTIAFLSRLSARYSRLVAPGTSDLSGALADKAEEANKTFPSDKISKELRLKYLLEAAAMLAALDRRLARCYMLMSRNPEGCFTTAKGKTVGSSEAMEKLDRMAQSLGEKIDRENELLKGQIRSVREKI